MTKKNLFKRIASVAMAGVLTLSMALPVSAASDDPNLVVEANTKYSTQIEAGKSVTLALMPGDDFYQRSGFDSAEDAANGLEVQSVTIGEDKLTGIYEYGSMVTTDYSGEETYAGTVKVTGAVGEYGPASLHIVNRHNDAAAIDMTVYVEAAETQDAVKVSKVSVADVSGSGLIEKETSGLSVAAATTTTENPYYNAEGSAQSYPTVGDALYSMVKANGMSFTQNGGYVDSITTSDGTKIAAYSSEDWTSYYGWNYCVYRNGVKVSDGDILSASVLEVKPGDNVYWAFGTYDQAAAYFAKCK